MKHHRQTISILCATLALSVAAARTFAQTPRDAEQAAAPLAPVAFTLQPEPAHASTAEGGGDNETLAKKLSNPIADLISIPIQFNYDEGYGPKDAGIWRLHVQPVIPFSLNEDWNLITRTIVPVIYQDSIADGVDSKFGLGDTVQSFFF